MLRETSTDLLLHNTKEAYKLTEVIILCNKAETLNQFLISFEKLLFFFTTLTVTSLEWRYGLAKNCSFWAIFSQRRPILLAH